MFRLAMQTRKELPIMKNPMRLIAVILSLFALIALAAIPVSADQPDGTHCPSDSTGAPPDAVNSVDGTGEHELDGVEFSWTGDPGTVTVENTNDYDVLVSFCVKSGQDFDGEGNKFIVEDEFALGAGATVEFAYTKAISYVALFTVTKVEPTPTPTPTPTPSPTPTPTPSPTPSESESEVATPTPTPSIGTGNICTDPNGCVPDTAMSTGQIPSLLAIALAGLFIAAVTFAAFRNVVTARNRR